jgi:hypothetical protein
VPRSTKKTVFNLRHNPAIKADGMTGGRCWGAAHRERLNVRFRSS